MNYLTFLILGLGAGAVFAAISLGIVLVYRGSGVVNFGQAALAIWPAYTFSLLRTNGNYIPPLPVVPSFHVTSGPTPFWASFLLALVTAAAMGWLAHRLVFRPLRRAPMLAKVVATVGIMLYLQALIVLRFGTNPVAAPAVLPSGPVHFAGVVVPRDRFYLTGLTVLTAIVLWMIYRYTRFGLATRAAAESEKGASLLGLSPDRLASVNWVLGATIAGLGGILVAPITDLSPDLASLLVVPALGAALVGRLSSFGLTAGAAIAIGIIESEITNLQTTYSWFPKEAVQEAVPFLVIVVVMYVLGDKLPIRGTIADARLPRASMAPHVGRSALICVALGTIAIIVFPSEFRLGLITSLVAAIVCLSFVVLTGYVGQISLSQMAFAGIAGFTLSHLTYDWGIPFPVAPILAALAAGAVGLFVGLPALRIRGVTLAIVTLATAVAIDDWLFAAPSFAGSFNGAPVRPPELFGFHFGIAAAGPHEYPNRAFGIFVLLVLALASVLVARMRKSVLGRRMLAVRTNERAAAAAGISVTGTKIAAYGISSLIAGFGGAMIAYQQGNPSEASFTALASVTFLAIAYLGGIASVPGAIFAGMITASGLTFTATQKWLNLPQTYQPLIAAAGLILMALLNPEGAWAVTLQNFRWLGQRFVPWGGERSGAGQVVAGEDSVRPRHGQAPSLSGATINAGRKTP